MSARWTIDQRSRALELLAKGKSIRKTAPEVGIGASTLRRHMKDPEFAADLKDLQQQAVSRAQRILNGGAADAARLMVRVARGGDATAQQIRAAEITMKLCGMKPPDRLEISGGVPSMSDADLAAALAGEAAKMEEPEGDK